MGDYGMSSSLSLVFSCESRSAAFNYNMKRGMEMKGEAILPNELTAQSKEKRKKGGIMKNLGLLLLTLVIGLPMTIQPAEASGEMTITQAGTTVIAPNVNCNYDWRNNSGGTSRGIKILADNVTIINPKVQECNIGISLDDTADGTPPTGVRVIADPNEDGYSAHGITDNRYAMRVFDAEGIEIGGVNGGTLQMSNFDKAIEFSAARASEVHHLHASAFGPNGEAAMFGIKALPDFERDNGEGRPFEWSDNSWHDIYIEGISEEALSFDTGGGDAGTASQDSDIVASVDESHAEVTLTDSDWVGSTRYDRGGYRMMFVSGSNAGEYALIVTHNGKDFTLYDFSPNWDWSNVAAGDKVSIGIVMHHNSINNNTVVAAQSYPNTTTGTRAPITYDGNQFYSTITGNDIQGQPAAYFTVSVFNLQDSNSNGIADPQAIMLRSATNNQSNGSVTGHARYYGNMNNCVSGNTIEHGDISEHWINWGSGSFTSEAYISGNTFTGNGNVYRTYGAAQASCQAN
jgi:hypothetical protein